MQEWLENNILMHSTHNEGKSVNGERFIRTSKAKKGKTVSNAFMEIINKSNRKPNKLWVDPGRELQHYRISCDNG